MKAKYRVVIIGGGVVGASIAYHLTKLGWTDVAIVERSVLTAGSSWHAAGGIHTLNADPNISALQAYTIDLLPEIEKESGINIGLHLTGGILMARDPDRWDSLRSTYRIMQSMGIDDSQLVTPDEIKAMCPLINTSDLLGGMTSEREGYVDPSGVVHAYARAAKNRGADIIEHNRVISLKQLPSLEWQVETEKGVILAEHVVNAGGLWAKQLGRMVGVELPVTPMEHHYLVTEAIPEIAELPKEMPTVVDLDGFSYMRQEQQGMLLGIYEINHKHWQMDGAPWDYGMELIQEDTDRISDELALAFHRYPVLENAGIRRWVNGAFTFSPDGNPLVGPIRGMRNYWVACGVMAGFLQGGGVGKSLAEWMVHGEAEADIFGMDIARYGKFAENREYIRQTTGQFYSRRFIMTYPNEQLPAGRQLKVPGAYEGMSAAGAVWGANWGLEMPMYFAPKDFAEKPSLRRSNAFDIIGAEARKVRDSAGLLDITGYSRYEVTGEGAEAWLDKIFASRLPKPGRARLAPMLGEDGRLKGDLTVMNWGDGSWWIMGSYYLREWHMRWFGDHMAEGVSLRDISDQVTGFGLSGPKSREILQKLTHQDVGALPLLGCTAMDVGLISARVARMSITGELGYEINCSALEHATLRRILLEAGAEFGMTEFGFASGNALRLEKSFGIWSREFTQGYTAGQTGLDRFIDWNKSGFIGEAAARAEKDGKLSKQVLVTLEVEARDADASGYEPIWQGDKRVGYVTSGGYGHTIGKSLAIAMIDRSCAEVGTVLSTHIVGEECRVTVIPTSPYDPEGKAMRG
ncbi:FAD-dependent oxidoreductase [Xinfangfangia sp. CPCC 101601]|uniref:FAD-dependent oxidoreductase n=1 Tax=Pseudogemmobacter lacusdianii TaxID=3069608 RepID=A0ABU0W1Z4_9RHOB|nr:FAD-dependent oxidoreductase [Xinfangfangia sp. CPCC 101601]MDQ2067913.1 FAD-dependent oxidoreductase [Xinfangfangia sp. CPCC 101601]